jgi:hypothetical protein
MHTQFYNLFPVAKTVISYLLRNDVGISIFKLKWIQQDIRI